MKCKCGYEYFKPMEIEGEILGNHQYISICPKCGYKNIHAIAKRTNQITIVEYGKSND